ncbi:MAG: hypothetical protein MUC92_06855 [Fimbriimonadaceae bacterium]|jgi:Tfp pilus assembly protein PilX|nr:hypothetical protein [Fimbriimonadaceae bacterium]
MNKNYPQVKRQKGMSLPNALLFVLVTGGMVVAAISLTTHMDRMAARGVQKTQSVSLAESGANEFYIAIYRQMRKDGTYPTSSGVVTVDSSFGGDSQVSGTYTAVVKNVEMTKSELADGSIKQNYTFVIQSKGVAKNGVDTVVQMTFNGSLVLAGSASSSATPSSDFDFGHGAILSNTAVRLITNGGIRTYDSNRRGHILGNEGLYWNRKDFKKELNYNPNVLEIQGQYQVDSQAFYAETISPSGLGNQNGVKNYRGVDPTNGSQTAEVSMLKAKKLFPSQATVSSWENSWIGAAKSGTIYSRSLASGDVPQRSGDQWRIIKAPAYIDGNLDISNGQILRLMPSDGATKLNDNVIYVNGDVKNLGMLYNLGVTLVIKRNYSDGSSSEYRIEGQGSPWTDELARLKHANLISLNQSPNAISISTDATTTYGFVYAALGGIKVTGNLEMKNSMLISGGDRFMDGKLIGVDVQPKGDNSFVVGYNGVLGGERPGFAMQPTTTDIQNGSGMGSSGTKILVPFAAEKPSNWMQVEETTSEKRKPYSPPPREALK